MQAMVIAFILFATAQATSVPELEEEWDYKDKDEETFHKQIFADNFKFVEEHNKKYEEGKVSYTVRIYKFSDLTQSEIDQMLKGYKPSNSTTGTRVKVQVQTGALEGQFFLKYGKLGSLIEQNLVDCSTNDDGCLGGLPRNAFGYVKENGGIDTEKSYPYEERQSSCRYKSENSAGGYVSIQKANEGDLKNAVATVGTYHVHSYASYLGTPN